MNIERQTYRVDRLHFHPSIPCEPLDFSRMDLAAVMIPLSTHQARIIVTSPDDALHGVLDQRQVIRHHIGFSIVLVKIEYTIILSLEEGDDVEQSFQHDFEITTTMLTWGIRKSGGRPVFKRESLNTIFDRRDLGKASGLQFIK